MRFSRALALGVLLAGAVVVTAPHSAKAAWVSYAANFSATAGYTYVSIVNVGKKAVTVTVVFRDADGTEVGSASNTLDPGVSWTVGTADAFNNPVSTGDFEGYVRIESSGSDKKLAVWGAVQYPLDGNGGIGNALALAGTTLSWTRAK